MKILVTGGSGFVGRNLIKELICLGHEVASFSRSNPHIENIKTYLGDISKAQDLLQISESFDAVFHTASKVGMWGRPLDFYSINVTGTKNVIDFCLRKKIPILVYTSTPSVVFSGKDICGADESLPYPTKFLNEYSKSKAQAEQIILSANSVMLKTIAIRPHLIYGKDDTSLIPKLIDAAKSGRLKIIGSGKNLVDMTHIDLVVKAHINAMLVLQSENNGGKAYFIGDTKPVNPWDFINQELLKNNMKPISKKVPLCLAYFVGSCCEFFWKLLNIYDRDPPMTRFIALNLAQSHYFSHDRARQDKII